jgi:hypothetical protein
MIHFNVASALERVLINQITSEAWLAGLHHASDAQQKATRLGNRRAFRGSGVGGGGEGRVGDRLDPTSILD